VRLKNPLIYSILAALLTLGMKLAAYFLTGSVGLLSDALEAVVNLLTAVTAFLSLRYAALPVDANHTYGHEKIEFFSSGIEGVVILIAAGGIAWYAVKRLFVPEELQALHVGAAISLGASAINWSVAQFLLRSGKRRQSLVMIAHGKHLLTDVWTTAGVLTGLGLVWLTGVQALDAVIALLVAGSIAWTGVQLVHGSFDGLMDHALPEREQGLVRQAIEGQLAAGMDYHALRTRMAGAHRFADFHLLVPGNLSVKRAHELIGRIEAAVRAALTAAEVTIHVEPIEERAAWEDSELVPLEQAARRARQEGDSGPPAG